MSTALEVMQAIVDNGGPKEMWVLGYDDAWKQATVSGVDLDPRNKDFPIFSTGGYAYSQASLTDPNKIYKPLGPWVNDWARLRAVNTDGELWEFSHNPGMVLGGWTSVPLGNWLYISDGHDPTNWENSLEERPERTKTMNCCKCDQALIVPIDFRGGNLICEECDTHMRKSRSMTAREFAKFVGENMGRYLYTHVEWDSRQWTVTPVSNQDAPTEWLYAHNTEGDLEWMELPQVEVE